MQDFILKFVSKFVLKNPGSNTLKPNRIEQSNPPKILLIKKLTIWAKRNSDT